MVAQKVEIQARTNCSGNGINGLSVRCKVVILNWNGREHLERFLPSVVATLPDGVGLVVADNGSEDDSCEFVERNFPGVTVMRFDRNYGYAGGYNKALFDRSLSDVDYFILLNSDVETPAGWCEPLIDRMEREPALAFIAPKILSFNDKDTFEYAGASGGFIDGLGYPFCRGRILGTVEKDRGQYDDARDVFWASGACLVARAEVFRALDGFDADFFAHMEEIDLCWRAQTAGWRVGVEPASKVYHLGGGTLRPSPYKIYLNFRNNLAMLYKNLSPRSRGPVIFTRMLADGMSAAVYFLTGRFALTKAVARAHRDYRRMKPALREKRKVVMSSMKNTSRPQGMWGGSIILRYIFGRRTFDKLL